MQSKGQDGTCPTVKVVSPVSEDNPHGYIVINESDFNPDVHEKYKEKKAATKAKADDTGKADELRATFSAMKKKQLQKWLNDAGIAFDANADEAALVELCVANAEPE